MVNVLPTHLYCQHLPTHLLKFSFTSLLFSSYPFFPFSTFCHHFPCPPSCLFGLLLTARPQANRSTSWSRAEDIRLSWLEEHCLGLLWRTKETGALSRRQSQGDHLYLSHPKHLCPRPDKWLVRFSGWVSSLERQEEAEDTRWRRQWPLCCLRQDRLVAV